LRKKLISYLVVALGAALLAVWAYRSLTARQDIVLSSPLTDEMMVMRTKGGMLEVSRITAREVFDGAYANEFLFMNFEPTVARIRVPVVYTYRIPLARDWSVMRFGQDFAVVAPKVEPSLPVAVDLSKMEKNASGTWSLLTGTQSLDAAERALTQKLAIKSRSAAYIQLQRDSARATVAEFVRKWLVTQTQYQHVDPDRVHVFFADEQIATIDPRVFPLNQQPEATSGAHP
jgi:hypothetical protein